MFSDFHWDLLCAIARAGPGVGVRMGLVSAFLADSPAFLGLGVSPAFLGLGVSAAGAGVLGAGSPFGVGWRAAGRFVSIVQGLFCWRWRNFGSAIVLCNLGSFLIFPTRQTTRTYHVHK